MAYTEKEEQIKDVIRNYYEGKDLKRLWFTLREVSHAYVNVPVELLKPILGDKWGYSIGHVVAYAGYLVGAYAVSAITLLLNNAVLNLLGLL